MSCSMESLYDAVRKETNKFHQWDTRMSVNLEARKQAFRNAEKILTENRATVIKARSATLELARQVNAERNKTIYEGKVCCGTELQKQLEHLSLANRDTDEELSDMNLELDKLKECLVEADQKRQVLSSQQAKMNDDDLDVPLQEAEKTLEHQEKILEKKTKAKEDLNKQMDRVKSQMAREFTRAIGIVHANLEKEKELRDQAQQVVSRMNFTIEQAEKRNKVEEEELINTPLFFQRGKRQFETPRVYGRKKHNAGCFSSSRFSLDDDDLEIPKEQSR